MLGMRGLGMLLGFGLLAAGCFRTTVRSGLPPGEAPEPHRNRWHSGFLLGAVETSGPYPVHEICPDGWAELRVSTNALQGLLTLITYGIYTPQDVTIVCAVPGAPGPPPRAGHAPHPPPAPSAYPPPHPNAYPPPPPEAADF